MRRFHFPLERVRQWRSLQVDVEFARLQKLFGDRARLDRTAADLERAVREAERGVAAAAAAGTGVDGGELGRLDQFHAFARRERQRIEAQRAAVDQQIRAQRQRLIGVRRDFRLLERLKEKARERWEQDYARELESLVAELHLARWKAK